MGERREGGRGGTERVLAQEAVRLRDCEDQKGILSFFLIKVFGTLLLGEHMFIIPTSFDSLTHFSYDVLLCPCQFIFYLKICFLSYL